MKTQKTIDDDRISHLPCELRAELLDRIPLLDAVRLSILSSLWVDSWKSTSKLELDQQFISDVFFGKTLDTDNFLSTDDFSKLVSSILLKHCGQIKKFLLFIPDLPSYPDTDPWVCYLTGKGVSDITIVSRYQGHLELSPYLFSHLTLENLSLIGFQLTRPHRYGGFKNLSCLEINDSVMNAKAFNILVIMSPNLNNLKLKRCVGFEFVVPSSFEGFKNLKVLEIDDIRLVSNTSVSALVSKSPNLLRLGITKCLVIGMGIEPGSVVINVPNLRFLLLDEHFTCYDIQNAANLVSVRLGLGLHGPSHLSYLQLLGRTLSSCPNIQSLVLEGQICLIYRPSLAPPAFMRLRKLSLVNLNLNNTAYLLAVMGIIQSCPAITIFTLTVAAECQHLDDESQYLHIPNYAFSYLRVVGLKLCCGTDTEMMLTKIILAATPALERLVIKSRGDHHKLFSPRVMSQLGSFRAASPKAIITQQHF